jgi:hypothetical protein
MSRGSGTRKGRPSPESCSRLRGSQSLRPEVSEVRGEPNIADNNILPILKGPLINLARGFSYAFSTSACGTVHPNHMFLGFCSNIEQHESISLSPKPSFVASFHRLTNSNQAILTVRMSKSWLVRPIRAISKVRIFLACEQDRSRIEDPENQITHDLWYSRILSAKR